MFDNYIQEPAYLSVMVAGAMTKSNKIGLVGGFPIPEVNRLMNAFMAGAKETNPKVEFSVSFINSWFDPPKAKEAAFAMIDKGADVMYAERFGVSDAAKEKGKLAIGNVINTQPQYPDTVVASALWHFEPSADRAIKLVKEGKFTAEDYGPYSMMKVKGSSLAPLGTFDGDHVYVAGSGDLDDCNGRTGVTPEFPHGTYYYIITDSYPYIGRCLKGKLS